MAGNWQLNYSALTDLVHLVSQIKIIIVKLVYLFGG